MRLLKVYPEIKQIINHKTDQKIGGLELVEACANGQLETVKALVGAGADINARELGGPNKSSSQKACRPRMRGDKFAYQSYNPLTIACLSGQERVVEYLLSLEPDILSFYRTNDDDKKYQNLDALHAACRRENNYTIIDMLLKKSSGLVWNLDNLTIETGCNDKMLRYAKEYVREKTKNKKRKNIFFYGK